MKIHIQALTLFKISPAQSDSLNLDQLVPVAPQLLDIPDPQVERESGHLKLTLYLFEGHCQIMPDQPVQQPPQWRRINAAGLQLIKDFEGLRLAAYRDAVQIWTIGYGSTYNVKPGDRITIEQAEQRLQRDLELFERGVAGLVSAPLTDNQFAAVVSLSFNVGLGNLKKSTLLKLLNQRKYPEAAAEFPRWNRAGGQVLAGLSRRRKAEQELFLT